MPFMPVINLDVGVRSSLKAYKMEQGMSESDADAWAEAHLDEGMTRMQAVRRLPENARDLEKRTQAAFQELKAWARSQP